jgi:hypothetical protein
MGYELIGGPYYPFDEDGVAGGDVDDYGAAGALDIIGYDDEDGVAGFFDDELDAIAGIEDDLDVLAGYDAPGSEVTRLLEATAGYQAPRGRRRPVARNTGRRVAARRVARTVNGLGRSLRRERARSAHMARQLGGGRGGGPPAGQHPSARVVPAAGGGSRTLVEREPMQSGVEPIGINSEGPVPAGQTRQLIVRPQVLFRPTRYYISETVGQNFLINNITVGKHSQFGTSGALPGATFCQENLKFAWKTCQAGQDITVTVTNITSAEHVFMSAMWGDSAE